MKLPQSLRIPYVEDKSFGFLFLIAIFVPLAVIPPLPDPLELVKFCLWLVLTGITLVLLVKKHQEHKTVLSSFVIIATLALFFWSILTTFWSLDVVNSIFGATIRLTNSVLFFGLWAVWIFLLSLQEKKYFEFLLKTLIVSGGLIAFWGIIQSFGIGYYGGLNIDVRSLYPSFLGNPNYSAMFLVPVTFLAPWAALQAKSKFGKVWYWAVFIMCVWGIIIFTSRGAVLGLMIPFILFVVLGFLKKQWKVVGVSLLIGLVALVISVAYLSAIRSIDSQSISEPADQSSVERFSIWDEAIDITLSKPLFGSGPSNFFLASRQFSNSVLPGPTWFDDVHNLVLHIAANMGIPALLAFLGIILAAVWNYYRYFCSQEKDFLLPALLLSGLLGWLIASSFNPVTVPNWLIFGALIVGLFQIYPQKFNLPSWGVKNWPIYLLAVTFIITGTGLLGSDILLWQSDSYRETRPHLSKNLLDLSLKLNPTNVTTLFELTKFGVVNKDYPSVEYYTNYLHKLHPRSAGVNQKIFYAYLIIYESTHSPEYKIKLDDAAKNYELSNPYNVKTYQDLAYVFLTVGDLDKSEQYAKKFIVMSGGDAFSWILLTKIYIAENNYKKTIFAYEKSYQLRPNKDFRYFLNDAKQNKTEGKDIILPMYFSPITY